MFGRSGPTWSRALVTACGVIWIAVLIAGDGAARHVTDLFADTAVRPWLRVIQFNLCDSGIADCYSGRSVRVAASLIRAEQPDVVTVNEICRHDVSTLAREMRATRRRGLVVSRFEAAQDRLTHSAYRCTNGQQYGIAVLARVAPARRYRSYGGSYPVQDLGDSEARVWLCLHAGAMYACTTHLASTSASVALAQCSYLTRTVVPTLLQKHGRGPVVLGADFNLIPGRQPDAHSCLVPGYRWADDGARQYVVATPGLAVQRVRVISMQGATDHPALLVDLITER